MARGGLPDPPRSPAGSAPPPAAGAQTADLSARIREELLAVVRAAPFERNDEALWERVRREADRVMHGLFRRGVLAGRTPEEAFQVHCGRDTMTQADLDLGIVGVLVAFAPQRPGEFVYLSIRLGPGTVDG